MDTFLSLLMLITLLIIVIEVRNKIREFFSANIANNITLKESIDKLFILLSNVDKKLTQLLSEKGIQEEKIEAEEIKKIEIEEEKIIPEEEKVVVEKVEEVMVEEISIEDIAEKDISYEIPIPEKPEEVKIPTYMPPPPPPKKGYEAEIGLRWFSRIGIILLVVGVAFFIAYAIQEGWLGPIGRLILGVIVGLTLLGLGEYFDKKEKYVGYARGLTGGAFAILYFTVYASYHLYKDYTGIPLSLNIILLSVIVFFGITFAVKYNSILIASEAFLLGYLTSYLTGVFTIYTLIYSTLLALALLYLVYRMEWFVLGAGGLGATYFLHINWLRNNPKEHLTNLVFLLIYFFIFTLISLIPRGKLKLADIENVSGSRKSLIYVIFGVSIFIPFFVGLKGIYAIYYLILAYALVSTTLRYKLGYLGAVGVAVNYYIFYSWYNQNKDLLHWPSIYLITCFILFSIYSILYGSSKKKESITENVLIVLLNVFCFFGFSLHKIRMDYEIYAGLFAILMSAFCLLLSYISSIKKISHLFITYLSLGVLFITLAVPLQLGRDWTPISWAVESLILLYLSMKFKNSALKILSQGVGIVAVISALHYIYSSPKIGLEVIITYIVSVTSFYLSAFLYHKESLEIEDKKASILSDISVYIATFLMSLLLFFKFKGAGISIAFSIEGLLLVGASIILKNQPLRICSQIIAIPTVIYTLLSYGSWSNIHNLWAIAYIVNIITFYVIGYLYKKEKELLLNYEKYLHIVYASTSTALTTLFFALYFKGAWISIMWGLQAIVILWAGFYMKNKYVRFVGVGVFILTIFKVLFFDLPQLDMIYRIISLIGIGVILLVASYAYYRYREQIEELFEEKK